MKSQLKQLAGFSGVGLFITLIGIFLTYVFIEILHIPLLVSYVTLYSTTIFASYLLNAIFVFKTKINFGSMLQYFGVYITGMIVGTLALYIFKQALPFEDWMLAYLVIPITTLWNYLFSARILKKE